METCLLKLAHKPTAELSVSTYTPPPLQQGILSDTLVLFMNGLSTTQSSWYPVAEKLIRRRQAAGLPIPLLLSYDRYGQGDSDSDPSDGPEKPHGHNISGVIEDLQHLLEHVCENIFCKNFANMRLILVCNAIGCALARLYTTAYPGRVEGLLFLDSAIANSDFVSIFPDPDSQRIEVSKLPPGVTLDDLRNARAVSQKYFHPTSPTRENMDHRDLPFLLPDADKPILPNGPSGKKPLLVVVGHDWNIFEEECSKGFLEITEPITNAYLNPHWASYNASLTKIAESEEVKIAEGCGHFIQKDSPDFVVSEINGLLDGIIRR